MFDVRFLGLREPTPACFGRAASIGVALWRASILLTPILCVVAAGAAYDMAQDVASPDDSMLLDPLVIIFTVGLSVLLYVFLSILAFIAAALLLVVAVAALLSSVPLTLILDHSLKRALYGEAGRLPISLPLVGIGGFLSMPFHAAFFPYLGYAGLLPLVAFAFLVAGREDLQEHAARRRLPVRSGCPHCGAASHAGASSCAACGVPLEASVTSGEPSSARRA